MTTAGTRRVAPASKGATAKTAAAGKRVRPARKATPPPAPPEPADAGADAGAQQEPSELRTAVVSFHGRDIEVNLPTVEQIVVYERVAAQFAGLETEGASRIDGQRAVRLYNRALKVIGSVVVSPDDVEWLEDQLLEKKLDLAGIAPLIGQAMDKLREANAHLSNRAQRRAQLKD